MGAPGVVPVRASISIAEVRAFTALVERSPAWREFAEFINSEAFTDTFRDVFPAHIKDMSLHIDLSRSHVDPSYVEPRSTLSETATPGDQVAQVVESASTAV